MKTIASVALLALASVSASGAGLVRCGKIHDVLDEPCTVAAVDVPIGGVGALAFDPSGVLHFSSESIVFKVDEAGQLARVAGGRRPGFAGDGGPAVDALLSFQLAYPDLLWWDYLSFIGGIAFDRGGNLYIADAYNNRVRIVNTEGTIRTFVGGAMSRADDVGLPIFSGFWWPQGVSVDSSGGVYVTGQGASLLRIPAEEGPIEQVSDWPFLDISENIALDGAGDVYVAGACSIKKVRRDGKVSLAAGSVYCDWRKPGLAMPYGVAVDAGGDLYIADTYNNCIRKAHRGQLTTIAGTCGGRESGGFSGDGGPAVRALLGYPRGVALDAAGNVYIADTNNNRVRVIDRDGIITTIAGNGEPLPR